MGLINIFMNSETGDVLRILRALLDRIPIVVLGNSEDLVENFINELTTFALFRSVLNFFTDFVDQEEYNQIVENEEVDYEISRNIYICYPFAIQKLLDMITNFKSWIIGFSYNQYGNGQINVSNQKLKRLLFKKLFSYSKIFLEVNLISNKIISKFHIHDGIEPDLTLERSLYYNAIQRTSVSIEKIRRVIAKRIKKTNIEESVIDDLLDFKIEEEHLKENLLKREILDFYEACKRAFSLLIRLDNIKDMGFTSKISPKTLYETISYNEIPIERIISFIYSEWGLNFEYFFDTNKMVKFMDRIESMWG